MNMPAVQIERHVVLDEFSYYLGNYDALKEALREMPGVPTVLYQVKGDRVFVFDQLLRIVSEQGLNANGKPDAALVAALLPQAWVSAEDATSMGVVPEPYDLHERDGVLQIRHRHFKAILPGSYVDQGSARRALAQVLLGNILFGEGQFAYRGQPMTLECDFDVQALPTRPQLELTRTDSTPHGWPMPPFHGGLTPLPINVYEDLVQAYTDWERDKHEATTMALARASDLWGDVGGFGIGTLNDPESRIASYQADDAIEMRRLHPELKMLNDGSLCDWFGSYQADCKLLRNMNPERDDGFLFFLIGQLAVGPRAKGDEALDAGTIAGVGLLHGKTLSEALTLGQQASRYDTALGAMAFRARTAVEFLRDDAVADRNLGRKVTTMADFYRAGRKFNSMPVLAAQSNQDLPS